MSVIGEYRAGGSADDGAFGGQGDDVATLQQPAQPSRVIAAQAAVAWVRPVWRLVQAEQVRRAPIQCLGLLAPLGEESLAVVDTLLAARDRDMGPGAGVGERRRPSDTAVLLRDERAFAAKESPPIIEAWSQYGSNAGSVHIRHEQPIGHPLLKTRAPPPRSLELRLRARRLQPS
jgi:hypothetical protein